MKKIFVAGHRGMVGSAICRHLQRQPDVEIITRTRYELNLCDQAAVHAFMQSQKPDEVILAAAKVGGIHANNTYPAEFIYQNLQIQNNVIHTACLNKVQKLLFLGSSCIYPREAAQPMQEEAILTGILEPTNEPYAIAKIAGIKMCEAYSRQYGVDFRSVMPTNLYGEGDNFHSENSHVIPSLIRRFHEAKSSMASSIQVWGSGKAKREFLHVDDMASACIQLMQLPQESFIKRKSGLNYSHINIGTGKEITISELALLIASVVGFNGDIEFDKSKPDGPPRKLLDISRIRRLGWKESIGLKQGLQRTYKWYLENLGSNRS